MNTILIPVDFSETSLKAISYAEIIAERSGAEMHLCHMYSPMMYSSVYGADFVFTESVFKDMEENARQQFVPIEEALAKKNIRVKTHVIFGNLTEDLNRIAKELKCELLVAGTTGSSTVLNKIFGSNASYILENCECPVILVPKDYEQFEFNHIVFADDFSKDELPVIDKALEFAHVMGVNKLDLLKVDTHSFNVFNDDSKIEKIINTYSQKEVKLNFVLAGSFEKGFEDYCKEHSTDLLIMSTEKKSFIQQLFSHSNTHYMAMHTKVPMMVFHV